VTTPARDRTSRLLLVASLLLGSMAGVLAATAPPSVAQGGADGEVVRHVTATRVFLDAAGEAEQVSSNDISLRVSTTTNLRGRQEIKVSWTGARPTGAVVADPNSAGGRNEEYPFVLLQCRGVDTTGAVPGGQERLSPQTCWTQTTSERYLEDSGNGLPAWRSDLYAEPDDREAIVGAPTPKPAVCSRRPPPAEHWLPFRAANGTVYYGGPNPAAGCVGSAPETDDAGSGGLPGNTTYGVTRADGTGSTQFAVWTRNENASLGCSADVACSLVAVPIVGISCDAFGTKLPPERRLSASRSVAADATCRADDQYRAGQDAGVLGPNPAVAGSLWWAASNWRNRISVPLDFAVTGDVCDVVSDRQPQALFGSVVLSELTASWQPKFCTDRSLFPFTHVQAADTASRNLLDSGGIQAALSSGPPAGGFSRPVVQAPVAVGGFAVAYAIDDADKQPYDRLRLNARLLAKLLTQSYPATPAVRDNYPALAGNPYSLLRDPEFVALNPGLPDKSVLEAASTIQTLATDADLMSALTRYLDADPEARTWLDGTPDPWGMKVNPSYRGVDLPVDSWPQLDDWPMSDPAALAVLTGGGVNLCYNRSPSPYLSLIANPTGYLSTIVQNIQYAVASPKTRCNADDAADLSQLALRQQGRQQVGNRFVLGLVSISATERYNLRSAALQTRSTVPAGQQFSDDGGRRFVGPDGDGLRAAADLLRPDEDAGAWVLDPAALSTASGMAAYPGLMPVYADIPTRGLSTEASGRLTTLLCYAADRGQVAGAANGQLPAGYLPMTAANGLGELRAYTIAAAAAVRAQVGDIPSVTDVPEANATEICSGRTVSPATPSAPAPTPSPSGSVPSGSPTLPTFPGGSGAVPPAAPSAAGPSVSAAPTSAGPDDVVTGEVTRTAGEHSSLGAAGVPAVLALALASGLAGLWLRWGGAALAGGRRVAGSLRTRWRR
jgi:hypothetical protein